MSAYHRVWQTITSRREALQFRLVGCYEASLAKGHVYSPIFAKIYRILEGIAADSLVSRLTEHYLMETECSPNVWNQRAQEDKTLEESLNESRYRRSDEYIVLPKRGR